MFGFLKKKLGEVVNKFSKSVEEESEVVDDLKETEIVDEEVKEVSKKIVQEPTKKDKKKPEKRTKKEETKNEPLKHIKKREKEEEFKLEPPIEEEPEKTKETKKQELESAPIIKEPEKTKETKNESLEHIKKREKEEEFKLEPPIEEEPKKRGFFSKISDKFTKFKLSEEKFDDLFWDLEVALLENNVAMEVIQKIKDDLREELTKEKISRKKASDIILESLHKSIKEVLSVEKLDLLKETQKKKPYVIAVIGVNGSGKTTTIAKLCHYLKKQKKSVVLAAADTFRAAAIQQIEHHAKNLEIKLIKHDYNSDPSAVAYDAIKHAESKSLDVVVIDTAGRLHSNDNLMNELKKLVRVNSPDLKLFVGESITGNDCVEQAKKYDEIIGIDAIILSKADIDEKGGAALSISYVTKKPVIFIGTGQNYEDLEPYNEEKIMNSLGI